MATAFIGEAILSASLDVLFDRLASPKVVDFFKGRKLNRELPEKLKITMRSVKVLLDDAEEKQITDGDVRKWLDDLKDAFYEADDLLDEIAYAALSSEREARPQNTIDRFRKFISSLGPLEKQIESKLVEIHEKLQHLVNQKNVLGLKEGTGEKLLSQKVPTTSLMDECVVYGRDEDKGVIIQLLLWDDANCSKLGLIPIVGMGGVGKTTLAQSVYNDSRLTEWFAFKAWIYVSEEFDVLKVTKKILNGVRKQDVNTPNDLELCQVALKNELTDKKFLLVLDDVWNDREDDWNLLLKPLKAGAKGSKIIVTTRSQRVASVIKVDHTHHLKGISADDCWALFSERAFEGMNPSEYPKFEEIGREIVKKCNGLPLAAKSLGSLLRKTKQETEEWDRVLHNDIWKLREDNILPALRLSYHFLPSHLKQCFVYCAIFPKGYEFIKEELVLLWMGEGFLGQAGFSMEREATGEEYFDDLVSRSFFNTIWGRDFIMHDLINDLARSVAGEFCFRLDDDDDDSREVPPKTRHLGYVRRKNLSSNTSEGIASAPLLRTLLLDASGYHHKKVIYDTHALMKFERLRVLSPFCWYGGWYVTELKVDDSIGNLRHLRYLNLSSAFFKFLPESLCSLYHLEILLLRDCYELVALPLNLGKLTNLCVLDMENTWLQMMPQRMGKLSKLQKLSYFVIGKESGSSIQELGNLRQLRGSLVIRNLQNVMDVGEALSANIKGKIHLKELELVWEGDVDDSVHARRLLEQLEPHKNVETLTIRGYGGTRFPDWIGGGSPLLRIITLKLDSYRHCCQLPPLGQLVHLKKLSITDFPRIVTIGGDRHEECFPEESLLPPTLTSLEIEDFPNLKSLEYKGIQHLTSLQHLTVRSCPELRLLPEEFLSSSLTSLRVWNLQNLKSVVNCKIQQAANLERLTINNCPKLKSVPEEGLPSTITFLGIIKFANLESLNSKGLQSLTSLAELNIENCPKLQSLPEEGLPSSLSSLFIAKCPLLKKSCEREKGEDWPKISHISRIGIY